MPELNTITVLRETVLPRVDVDGSLATTQEGVSLINDEDAPGANKVYGTDASGNKGWKEGSSVTSSSIATALGYTPDNVKGVTASGIDTYAATYTPAPTAYATGQRFTVIFTNANTGAATLNLNELGAVAIKKNVSTALSAGDIAAGEAVNLVYDGTNFQIIGGGSTYEEDFSTLVDGAAVTWNTSNKQTPLAKLTSTQSFTLNMTNVKSGASGVLKLITGTASAITLTFDTDFTNKALNSTITSYTFPAITAKEYFLSFIVDGTTIEWVIADTEGISDPGGSNDDLLQKKAGEWTYRTISQVLTDLALITDIAIHGDALATIVLTNMTDAEQVFPIGNALHIIRFDCTKYKSLRINCRVTVGSASANSPRMYPQYTTDLTGSTGWTTIGAGTIVSNEAISLVSSVFNQVTSWITIPSAAKTDVLLRLATAGGDGVADPTVSGVHLQLRTA